MTEPLDIIAMVFNELTSTGHTHTPSIELRETFDLSDFKKQESGYSGVEYEWVKQSGPGICGDDYQSTVAVPIDARQLLVIHCDT